MIKDINFSTDNKNSRVAIHRNSWPAPILFCEHLQRPPSALSSSGSGAGLGKKKKICSKNMLQEKNVPRKYVPGKSAAEYMFQEICSRKYVPVPVVVGQQSNPMLHSRCLMAGICRKSNMEGKAKYTKLFQMLRPNQ